MRSFKGEYDIYSPRWGHTDRYTVEITEEEMKVAQAMKTSLCTLGDNGDPEWAGHNAHSGNPLMNIFANDSIHAPAIVPDALEWAWQRWRDEEVNDDDFDEGMRHLFEWIDLCARNKPASELWRTIF
jgi:hypothetical protein